jgi:hypothetical protein
MTMSSQQATAAVGRVNAQAQLIVDFYDRLRSAIVSPALADVLVPSAGFSPPMALPALTDDYRQFFEVATAGWQDLAEYDGHQLKLLDLTGNPGTHTTKSFASLLIVARAVEHIRRTGERITILSPTSANKGTALRDAVLRALTVGLVEPEQLRVVTINPRGSGHKLRDSALAQDPELARLNPVFVYSGGSADQVKELGRQFCDRYSDTMRSKYGTNLWYSLDLGNYLLADTARAFFEQQVDPVQPGRSRVHAHAVSSAFGLLGYHLGRELLEAADEAAVASRPASLLVQHLGTPDMVLNLVHGDFDRENVPGYRVDSRTGLHHQDVDPRFPFVTDDPAEVLDPTFYTRMPATSPRMNEIIRTHGGDGIVVSRAECLRRYPEVEEWMATTARPLPADPEHLREWSLMMVCTGVLEAVDRGLLDPGAEIVVHGSGWYSADEYDVLPQSSYHPVDTVADMVPVLLPAEGPH